MNCPLRRPIALMLVLSLCFDASSLSLEANADGVSRRPIAVHQTFDQQALACGVLMVLQPYIQPAAVALRQWAAHVLIVRPTPAAEILDAAPLAAAGVLFFGMAIHRKMWGGFIQTIRRLIERRLASLRGPLPSSVLPRDPRLTLQRIIAQLTLAKPPIEAQGPEELHELERLRALIHSRMAYVRPAMREMAVKEVFDAYGMKPHDQHALGEIAEAVSYNEGWRETIVRWVALRLAFDQARFSHKFRPILLWYLGEPAAPMPPEVDAWLENQWAERKRHGQHALLGQGFVPEESADLARKLTGQGRPLSRANLQEIGKLIRRRLDAAATNKALTFMGNTEEQPESSIIAIQKYLPGVVRETKRFAEFLAAFPDSVTIGTERYYYEFRIFPDGMEFKNSAGEVMPAFAHIEPPASSGGYGRITLHLHENLGQFVHKGMEYVYLPTVASIRPDQRHHWALAAETMFDGVIVDLIEDHFAVPGRFIRELRQLSFEQLQQIVQRTTAKQFKAELLFNRPSESNGDLHLYYVLLAEALEGISKLYMSSKAPPLKTSSKNIWLSREETLSILDNHPKPTMLIRSFDQAESRFHLPVDLVRKAVYQNRILAANRGPWGEYRSFAWTSDFRTGRVGGIDGQSPPFHLQFKDLLDVHAGERLYRFSAQENGLQLLTIDTGDGEVIRSAVLDLSKFIRLTGTKHSILRAWVKAIPKGGFDIEIQDVPEEGLELEWTVPKQSAAPRVFKTQLPWPAMILAFALAPSLGAIDNAMQVLLPVFSTVALGVLAIAVGSLRQLLSNSLKRHAAYLKRAA